MPSLVRKSGIAGCISLLLVLPGFAGVVFQVEVTFRAENPAKMKSDIRSRSEAHVKNGQPMGLQALTEKLGVVLKQNKANKSRGGIFTPAGAVVVRSEHAALQKEVTRRLKNEKDPKMRQVLEDARKKLAVAGKLLPAAPSDQALLKSEPRGKLFLNGRK